MRSSSGSPAAQQILSDEFARVTIGSGPVSQSSSLGMRRPCSRTNLYAVGDSGLGREGVNKSEHSAPVNSLIVSFASPPRQEKLVQLLTEFSQLFNRQVQPVMTRHRSLVPGFICGLQKRTGSIELTLEYDASRSGSGGLSSRVLSELTGRPSHPPAHEFPPPLPAISAGHFRALDKASVCKNLDVMRHTAGGNIQSASERAGGGGPVDGKCIHQSPTVGVRQRGQRLDIVDSTYVVQ
jgi:hypothetical protein